MKTSIVNNKGQVVIPSDLRKKFRIEKGTKIFFSEDGDEIRLLTMARMIESNFGFMKTRGKLLKELMKKKNILHSHSILVVNLFSFYLHPLSLYVFY